MTPRSRQTAVNMPALAAAELRVFAAKASGAVERRVTLGEAVRLAVQLATPLLDSQAREALAALDVDQGQEAAP
ncbi:MAG: hypothetical protein ACRDJW_11330 [Thermomicrobiales bacterium]